MTFSSNPAPSESATLDKVIDSVTRRLNSVPLGDPAARLLREQLEEVTELRDRIARREKEVFRSQVVTAIVCGYIFCLMRIGFAVFGVYDLATPGRSARSGVICLAVSLALVLLGLGFVMTWNRKGRAARQA